MSHASSSSSSHTQKKVVHKTFLEAPLRVNRCSWERNSIGIVSCPLFPLSTRASLPFSPSSTSQFKTCSRFDFLGALLWPFLDQIKRPTKKPDSPLKLSRHNTQSRTMGRQAPCVIPKKVSTLPLSYSSFFFW